MKWQNTLQLFKGVLVVRVLKHSFTVLSISDALRDLLPLAQFKKREITHGEVLL